ncbi:hypothetical protein ColLi_01592 [Colletotrichum liriopes]|uniref:Integral membrane protein n=1 Tax=Colletotrichum liriopes TaxID=708192 RepID=A0AA37GDM3_9PEZI|nr:hypothetical protein ColLi_01592 [Colletotrichum liriopes]
MTDEVALALTPEQYKSHETGAKWLFAACKTLPEERLVKVVSVITVAAYLATLSVVTGHCRPMHKLWQVYPYPGDNRKLAFGLMFCAGFFIIICTLLRCIICLHTPERLDLGLNWSIRETVVAIICTNAPSIKPLFPSRKMGSSNTSNPTGLVTFGGSGGTHKMSRIKGSHQKLDDTSVGSQEHIVNPKGGRSRTTAFADDHSSDDGAQSNRGIQVTNEYTVEVGRQ